jgi:cytochrome c oxidase assembly protein subunit 15
MDTAAQDRTRTRHRRAIRAWLLAVAAVVFVLVCVGGATRLTESGLSIVEWQLVTGVFPPVTEAGWQAEFAKYRTIPQYSQLNAGMSLADFKAIYWWEWSHRFLGRFVGLAYLAPFLWFLLRGWVEPGLRMRLWAIFGLGALQGAVGWWMVASGLVGRVNVSQYRLATHLTLACVIFAALLWTAARIEPRPAAASTPRLRRTAHLVLLLVFVQIYLGAIVAGLRAGLLYNTWPLIDGAFIPDVGRLLFETPAWRNMFENPLAAQFNHRMMAYVLWIVVVLHAIDAVRSRAAVRPAAALAGLVTLQAVLGIVTLLAQAPIGLALAHQTVAMILLAAATLHVAWLQPDHRQVQTGRAALRAAPPHRSAA